MRYPLYYIKNKKTTPESIIREGSNREILSYESSKPIKYFLSEKEAVCFWDEVKEMPSLPKKGWVLMEISETEKEL